MNKSAIITWVSLLILTILSVLFSNLEKKFIVFLLLGLAILKFFGVVFQFMELKKAHVFWKVSILFFVLIFSLLILLIY